MFIISQIWKLRFNVTSIWRLSRLSAFLFLLLLADARFDSILQREFHDGFDVVTRRIIQGSNSIQRKEREICRLRSPHNKCEVSKTIRNITC
jgi:hypothetical protein